MRKNVKLLVAILLVASMLVTCVACGSSSEKAPETKTEAVKTEGLATETPEVAATEAHKVEVVEIDPETYIWSDDEKLVYEDETSIVKYYKGEEKSDSWLISQVFNDAGDLVYNYVHKHSSIVVINEFINLIYKYQAQAESIGDNTSVIVADEPATELDLEFKDYEIQPGMKITYTKGDNTLMFFDDNGTIKFAKMDGETKVWCYPVDDVVRLKVARMAWSAWGDTQE